MKPSRVLFLQGSILGVGGLLQAADWNVAGPADWAVATNWNTGAVPAATDVNVMNGGTALVTSATTGITNFNVGRGGAIGFVDIQAGGTVSTNSWTAVGLGPGVAGSELKISGGTFTHTGTSSTEIGADRNGTLTVTDGAANLHHLRVGFRTGGDGHFDLSGGTVNLGGDFLTSQQTGTTGESNLTGGTLNVAGNTSIATDAGSNGIVRVAGATYNQNGGNMWIGQSGTGELEVNSGTVANSSNAWIGDNLGAVGELDINGGTYTATSDTYVGVRGTGLLDVSGGTSTFTNIEAGRDTTGVGTINVSGGTATTSGHIELGDANGGTGDLNVSGGTLNIGGHFGVGRNGNGNSTVNQTAGTINVSSWTGIATGTGTGTAVVNLSGGQYNQGGPGMEVGADRTGLLNVSGTSDLNIVTHLEVGVRATGDGMVNQTGGDIDIGQDLQIGSRNAGAKGDFNMSAGTLNADELLVADVAGTDASFDHTGGTATFRRGEVRANAVVANFDTSANLQVAKGVHMEDVNVDPGGTSGGIDFDVAGGTATAQMNLLVGSNGNVFASQDFNVGNGDPTGGATTGNLNILGDAQVDGLLANSGTTTVGGGQTLGGAGQVNTLTGQVDFDGGILSAGNFLMNMGPVGTLGIASPALDFFGGSTWKVDFDGPALTDLLDYDGASINLTDVALAPNQFTYSGQAAAPNQNIGATSGANGDFHWILDNDGANPVVGTFSNTFSSPYFQSRYPNATQFITLGQPYAIFYDADFGSGALTGGNDILLVALPEPSRAMLLGLGLGCLLLRRRRR